MQKDYSSFSLVIHSMLKLTWAIKYIFVKYCKKMIIPISMFFFQCYDVFHEQSSIIENYIELFKKKIYVKMRRWYSHKKALSFANNSTPASQAISLFHADFYENSAISLAIFGNTSFWLLCLIKPNKPEPCLNQEISGETAFPLVLPFRHLPILYTRNRVSLLPLAKTNK